MHNIEFLWNKLLKKIRGSAIANSEIHKCTSIGSGSHIINSSIDKFSYCGYNCEILNCQIGKFCCIANNVTIGGAKHPIDWVSMSPAFHKGKDHLPKKYSEFESEPDKVSVIGNDVWIGFGAFIKSGVNIGDGAVIGAGAVVVKDVLPFEIVGGNPAKRIRFRFNDEIINQLKGLEWWNFNDNKLKSVAKYIKDPALFIQESKKTIH